MKIRRSHDRLKFIMKAPITEKTVFILRRAPESGCLVSTCTVQRVVKHEPNKAICHGVMVRQQVCVVRK